MTTLLVDDHALIREALRGALSEVRPNVPVVEASSCREATKLMANLPGIDLVLLDLGLPDGDGMVMLGELRQLYPSVGVVVLSAHQDRERVARALDQGAMGFIPKSAPRAVILSALQLIMAGGVYVPPEILESRHLTRSTSVRGGHGRTSPADLGLTQRQLEVLALMMRGKSNKAICRALDLAEPTVKNHITAILKALRATNRTEAVIMVGELGWTLPSTAES